MYDDNLIDATILDSLVGTDQRRRQEIIRTFIRVGYNQIMSGSSIGESGPESLSGLESLQAVLVAGHSSLKIDPSLKKRVNGAEGGNEIAKKGRKDILLGDDNVPDEAQEISNDILLGAAPVIDDDDDIFNPLRQMKRKFSGEDK
jgi:hypothetical protein